MDYNLIQAPELIRRLVRRLGMKQAHITPTLAETVQAVVLLDDITAQRSDAIKYATGGGIGSFGDGAVLRSAVMLYNPLASGKRLRVLSAQNSYATALSNPTDISYSGGFLGTPIATLSTPGGTSFTDTNNVLTKPAGQMLVGRAAANVGGTASLGFADLWPRYAPFGLATPNVIDFEAVTFPQLWLEQGFYFCAQLQSILVGDRIIGTNFQWYEEDV